MAKIGIPAALLHYTYGTLWEEFFRYLGHEVISSGSTTKNILDTGVKMATDQTCLPIKTCFGHLESLKDKVDFIFFPRWVSIEKDCYICPKFMGVPDMARASINGLPPLISPDAEGYSGRDSIKEVMMQSARTLGHTVKDANKAYQEALRIQAVSPSWQKTIGRKASSTKPLNNQGAIAVLGHPYNIYDRFTSMDLIQKLMDMGFSPVTYEMLGDNLIQLGLEDIPRSIFWTFGKRIVGAARYLIANHGVLGVIHMASFACGPDAFTGEMIAMYCEEKGMPFLELSIDEHTGEAGFQTRLEAYADMLERRGLA